MFGWIRTGGRAATRAAACVALAGLLTVACTDAGPGIGGAGALPEGAAPVPFTDLAAGHSTGFAEPDRMVMRSDGELAEFWVTFEVPRTPKTDPPVVDFGRMIVIAAAMGERSTGGYAVTIEAVHEAEGKLYVSVTELSPGPSCMTTQALTQPVFAVTVESAASEVVFVERAETSSCK